MPHKPRDRNDDPPFQDLLDALPVAAYTCDEAGLITYFNDAALQLWGRAPALKDPVDRYCGSFRLFGSDGAPIAHAECWMARALRTGRRFNGHEITIERPDGSRVAALAHANPLRDNSRKLIGAVNVLVDISDRKRAEDAQRFLAAIVESSDDAIISKTLDGRMLSWNVGAERLLGYTAHEAIGKPITLVVPPELEDEERSLLAKLARGQRIDHYETVRRDKLGRRIDVSLTLSPLRDDTGRIVGASSVARDVSSRKQVEAALLAVKDELATQLADLRRLHEMSVRLSTTLELQPILEETLRTATSIEGTTFGLLSLCDPEHQQLEVGASLGFDGEFLKTIEHIPPGGGACGTCFLERRRVVVEDTETDPAFAEYRGAAREAGFRAVHSTPLITRSGNVVGVLSTHFARPHRPTDREMHLIDLCARQAVDFIENARLYVELRDADRRKDEFLAVLAHELRNPLAPISNALQILRLSDDLSPATEKMRNIMERQVNQLIRLVDDLMEVSRIARAKIELRRQPVDLLSVIGSAVETSQPLIEAAGHRLAISLASEPMTLDADPVRLAQVIANLLNNAAKYTEEGGQIWLAAKREGNEVVVSVKDTGLGISPDMLPRVFDMFSQWDRTRYRAQGGLGIGLTLAKNLVQMHGGRIEARSDGLGQGSEFIVRLPLVRGVLHPAPATPTIGKLKSLPRRKILVVDDTRAAAYVLGKLLEKMGQEVHTEYDAPAALEYARTERPDLVISDVSMPQMSGYDLARQLRQEPSLDGLVLVALTGYGQDKDRQRAMEAGFNHHLIKPASIEALHTLLASLPRKSPKRSPAKRLLAGE